MNGQNLVDRAEARFGDSANAVYSADEWLAYLNEAQSEVFSATALWPFFETLNTSLSITGGTGTVALPTDVTRVSSVYNATDEFALVPIPGQSQVKHWFPDPESSLGTPQWYRVYAGKIEVYPWPSVTTEIDVEHPVAPADIAAGTEPVFPEQYHRILILGALAHAYQDDENLAMARSYQDRFDRMLAGMISDLLSPKQEGYPEIVDTF